MAFETEKLVIANGALLRLGAKPISSFTELSDRATLCAQFIDSVRLEVLRAHPWNFALHRLRLGANKQTMLTLGAVSGSGVLFQSSADAFEADDVGQRIIATSTGSARIASFQSATAVLADIEGTFSATTFLSDAWRIAPSWGNNFRYVKPAGYVRVFEVRAVTVGAPFSWSWWNDRMAMADPIKVEGKYLVTDVGAKIDIQFTRNIEDPTLWDELSRTSWESLLAFRICYGVTGSLAASKTQWDSHKMALSEARTIDGQEGSADDSGSTILIDVRQ